MKRFLFLLIFLISLPVAYSQSYWNHNTQLVPWRMPFVTDKNRIEYIDLDGDGDPDILKAFVMNDVPVMWVDDDDDMQYGDLEGDYDNDCLLIDLNRDGIFAGPQDLCIDYIDTDNDGIADIQAVIKNGGLNVRNYFDWGADYMYIIDFGEKDGIKNYIDWNTINLMCWQKNGHSNFYTDYHGNTLFLKMHASTFRIHDLRYNWENPFIFYDMDNDNLSEVSIRLVDTPDFRPEGKIGKNTPFYKLDKEHDVLFSKKIDWAAIAWDLDNDNGQGNEFDFDMTIHFAGAGFDYSDQIHKIPNMKGLEAANKFFYDSRWREMDELIYPDEKNAYRLIFEKGKWDFCWFVFDEDDDCNRWERVELYQPKELFEIGKNKGGLDNNPQADAVGDRGEFDQDNSGKGNLYIGPFDGKIHLYGAEWGAWRIDQNARNFQGYGGLYPPNSYERLHPDPQSWATIHYSDTDHNGFIDRIAYDLDGDKVFEEVVDLKELGISDQAPIFNTANANYNDFTKLFSDLTYQLWARAEMAQKIAARMGISSDCYAFYKQPRSLHERYDYGFWLNFYLYKDMMHLARLNQDKKLEEMLKKAYYSGDWSILEN